MATVTNYPVRVDARLDRPLSRWLWLVKGILAVPHYLVLLVLWLAFAVLSIGAFFAILVSGRYPRSIFDFNVGVLRWSWRVQYYSFGALGTDRYPPFSLQEVPDYPAHLQIEYPEHLSRGLVLVKWWLLAIPHYLIVAVFAGGTWLASRGDSGGPDWAPGGGLIGLLVLIAGVMLAVTGRYPEQLYDFILGLDRWVLRVAAYAGLMTDAYPPFRLDMGGAESGAVLVVPPPSDPSDPGGAAPAETRSSEPPDPMQPRPLQSADPDRLAQAYPGEPGGPPAGPRSGWTPGRVASVVVGSLLTLISLGLLAAGSGALWVDQQREDGYVTSSIDTRSTNGYAIVSDRIQLDLPASGWQWSRDLLGTVRIRVTGRDNPTFVGIAPTDQAERYLQGVARTVLVDLHGNAGTTVDGTAPETRPGQAGIWDVQSTGTGTQTLTWTPRSGDWTVVVMNADAARGLTVSGDVGATVPKLTGVAVGLLIGGVVLLAAGVVLIVVPAARAARRARRP